MVDPFYMMILMHHLGSKYIVWDKAAEINFLSPGRSTVHADIRVDLAEIEQIRELAENYEPVLRTYHLNIFDESGVRIAEVQKTLYIRRKKQNFSIKISAKSAYFYLLIFSLQSLHQHHHRSHRQLQHQSHHQSVLYLRLNRYQHQSHS